jgi:putative intracellular protease/amidase
LVAGLAQAQVSDIPAIGASGAIAALMGAFAVQLPLTKIRILLVGLLPIPVAVRGEYGSIVPLLRIPPVSLTWLKLRVPAFVLLMLWGGLEVYNGVTNLASGVGHWAHAGGFAFGVAVALVVRLFGVDQKISRAIDDKGGVVSHAALLEAARLTDAGRPGIAILRLRKLLENPELNRFDVSLELLRAAEKAGSRADRCAAYANLIEHSARSGSTSAVSFFEEAVAAGLEAELPWRARIVVAHELARASRAHEANALLERIIAEAPESEGARQAATAHARLAG